MFNLEKLGKNQVSKGKPIKTVNYPFLVFFPNILFLPEFDWGSSWMGMRRVWEKKLNWEEHPFLKKHVFTSWERKQQKMYAHSLMHSRFHLPSHFGEQRDVFWSPIIHSQGPLTQLNVSRFLSFMVSVVSSWCMPRKSILDLWSESPAKNYYFVNFISCCVCIFFLGMNWFGEGSGNWVWLAW